MENIGTRVRRERESQGMERRDLASKTGIGYSTLAELERGGMRTTTKLRAIAEALGVSQRWLETGKGPKVASDDAPAASVSSVLATETAADYVRVQQLDGDADMGDGRINDDFPDVVRGMDFAPTYIRSIVGFVPPPGRLVLVTGRGDSMIPVIQPGEALMVDTGVVAFDGDGIYLLNSGNGQQVKGLQDRGDAIYIVSANAALYPAFPMPKGTVIGGKVYLRNRIERFN